MPIRFNTDCDPDFAQLRIQGRNIPLPTFITVDDGENLQGGATPGGGSAAGGSTGGNAVLTNQGNFSQIQGDPFPPCPAHGTLIAVANEAGYEEILVQDITPAMLLWTPDGNRTILAITRRWCEDLWYFGAEGFGFRCSPDHRVIAGQEDFDGTGVGSLKPQDSVLIVQYGAWQQGMVSCSENANEAGWVYRISLESTDDPRCHWFITDSICSHNVKPVINEN